MISRESRRENARSRWFVAVAVCLVLASCSSGSDTEPVDITTASPSGSPTTVAPSSVATGRPSTITAPPDPSVAIEVTSTWHEMENRDLGFYDPPFRQSVMLAEVEGDLAGSLFSVTVNEDNTYVSLAWFEGTIAACGTGGLAMRSVVDFSRQATAGPVVQWEIVPGIGTGDLATVTGSGSAVVRPGMYSGNQRAPWDSTATIVCDPPGDDHAGFATSLLEPAADEGIDAGIPAHTALRLIPRTINPPDALADPPKITLESVEYADARMWSITFTAPDSFSSPLRNTFVGLVSGPTACSDQGFMRVFIDDVLYPEYAGAWDLPPAANNGSSGGGRLTGPGRVSCAPAPPSTEPTPVLPPFPAAGACDEGPRLGTTTLDSGEAVEFVETADHTFVCVFVDGQVAFTHPIDPNPPTVGSPTLKEGSGARGPDHRYCDYWVLLPGPPPWGFTVIDETGRELAAAVSSDGRHLLMFEDLFASTNAPDSDSPVDRNFDILAADGTSWATFRQQGLAC